MRLRSLAVLVAGLIPLVGCSVHNHSDSSRVEASAAGRDREYSSSWIASRRGGAAMRDAGYQQVLGTPAAISPSPAALLASQSALTGPEAGLLTNLNTRSIRDAQQSAIANSLSAEQPASLMAPIPVTTAAQFALSVPPAPAPTIKKAPAKKRVIKKKPARPASKIDCNPPAASAPAPDGTAGDATATPNDKAS